MAGPTSLGLGALCLIIAALIFVGREWGSLGLASKVMLLGSFTLCSAAAAAFVTRRGLRASAEMLWTITLVDLGINLLAGRAAGLAPLARLSGNSFGMSYGALLAITAISAALWARNTKLGQALTSAQLIGAAAGTAAAYCLVVQFPLPRWAALIGAIGLLVGLCVAAAKGRLPAAAATWALGAGWTWLALLSLGIPELTQDGYLGALVHGRSVAFAAAAALVIACGPVIRLIPSAPATRPAAGAPSQLAAQAWQERGIAATGWGMLSVVIIAASADVLAPPLALIPALALVTALSFLPGTATWPGSFRIVQAGILALAAGYLAWAAALGVFAGLHSPGPPWSLGIGDHLVRLPAADGAGFAVGQLMILLVVALAGAALRGPALLAAVPEQIRARWSPTRAALWLAFWGAAADLAICGNAEPPRLLAVLGWLVFAALAAALGLIVEPGWAAGDAVRPPRLSLAVSAAAVAMAELVALPSDLATLAACCAGCLWSAAILRFGRLSRDLAAGVELLGLGQFFVAALAAVRALDPIPPRALVVALLAVTAVTGIVAANSRRHRWWAWIGVGTMLVAYWVQLAHWQVLTVEAHTVPAGLAALAAGLVADRRGPERNRQPSWPLYGPGLLVLTMPTLIAALSDPISVRALIAGGWLLALIAIGGGRKLLAPWRIGTAGFAVLALTQLWPYAAALPRWLLLGLAGLGLLTVGVCSDQRRASLAYTKRLITAMR
ncbi:MAG: hypothetical protein LBQ06_06890 [Frankiaceae bacterium]|nr:hypothetical protein [Frankiaceae bacterium]